MADGIKFDASGLEGLREKIQGLKQEVIFKGGRSAVRAAAIVLREQARSNARRLDDYETEEAIWKNIDVRWNPRAFKRTGTLPFRLGILGGAKQYANTKDNVRRGRAGKTYATAGSKSNPGGDTWYWRFLEFGTQHIAARPFLRNVPAQAGQKAIDVFARKFNEAIDRRIRRGGAYK